MIIINPGTEGRTDATIVNAFSIVDRICAVLSLPRSSVSRIPDEDMSGGFYAFRISSQPPFLIHVPGDNPDQFFLGRPFTSRRMYVDGSSWLWNYAIGAINRKLGREL